MSVENRKFNQIMRDHINGAQLSQFAGKNVCVFGNVTSINPNGLSFEMKTTDDITVKVNLKNPIRDLLEGYVEVRGVPKNKCLECDTLVQFPTENNTDFDASSHNTVCQLYQSMPRIWCTNAE